MTHTQRWISATIVVLALGVGIIFRTIQPTNPVDAAPSISQMNANTQDVQDEPEYEMALQNGYRLIGRIQPTEDPATHHPMSVIVLGPDGSERLLATADLSGPGHSVILEDGEYDGTVALRVLTQWEGYDDRISYYIRKSDGSHALTTRYQNGQAIVLSRGEKTLDISLAPENGCGDNKRDPNGTQVTVTGILVNGHELPFKKSYPVTCTYSEMFDSGFYPEIPEPEYYGGITAQGEDFLYVLIPGPVTLKVDVKMLTPDGIAIEEF